MSHVVCGKKAVDNYGALGSEAAALVAANFDSFLTQEAAALLEACKASCDSWYNTHESLVEYESETPKNARAKELIQLALNESYASCEYAEAMRSERDDYNARRKREQGLPHRSLVEWALDLRKQRDKMLKTFRDIADEILREQGYEVPVE